MGRWNRAELSYLRDLSVSIEDIILVLGEIPAAVRDILIGALGEQDAKLSACLKSLKKIKGITDDELHKAGRPPRTAGGAKEAKPD